MMEFKSLGAFAGHLAALELPVRKSLERGLDKVAAKIEETAKDELGHYQDGVGPFLAWEELTESTKADRVSQGYTENDPGLRSGAMRQSIGHQTNGLEASVGSNDDHLVFFELGTPKQTPRSVLGEAALKNHDAIGKTVGGAAVTALLGGKTAPDELDFAQADAGI